jgi:hypothetical protein
MAARQSARVSSGELRGRGTSLAACSGRKTKPTQIIAVAFLLPPRIWGRSRILSILTGLTAVSRPKILLRSVLPMGGWLIRQWQIHKTNK